MDDIELPPLPEPDPSLQGDERAPGVYSEGWNREQVREAQRAAIAADRAKGGEAVAWQYRERSPDPDDNNEWSSWREVTPGDLEMRRKLVAARPDRRELRPLFTRPSPAPETREGLRGEDALAALRFALQDMAAVNLPVRETAALIGYFINRLNSLSTSPTQAQDAEQAAMLDWLHTEAHATSYTIEISREAHFVDGRRCGSDYTVLRTRVGAGPWVRRFEGATLRDAIRAAMKREGA